MIPYGGEGEEKGVISRSFHAKMVGLDFLGASIAGNQRRGMDYVSFMD